MANCKEPALDAEPNVGDKKRASTSLFEALAGRNIWLNVALEKTGLSQSLASEKVSIKMLRDRSVDSQVKLHRAVSDLRLIRWRISTPMHAITAASSLRVEQADAKSTAFVFIKPHAVTGKVKELGMAGSKKAGLQV